MKDVTSGISKDRHIFFLYVFIFLASFFYIILYRPIVNMFFEADFWIYPSHFHIFTHNSFLKTILVHLFDPYKTGYYDPISNIFYFILLSFFSPQAKYFIFTSITLHLFISILLFFIIYKSKLDFRIAFFSATIYFSSFFHFPVYLWPPAVHHLLAIFFTILVFYLYLETDQRMNDKKSYHFYYWITLFSGLMSSFCSAIIFILPAGIMAHILFDARDHEARIKKYDRWLPLFIIYLGYPLLRTLFVPQYPLRLFFAQLGIPFRGTLASESYVIAFLLGIVCLFLFRFILTIQKFKVVRRLELLITSGVVLFLVFYLFSRQFNRNVATSDFKGNLLAPFNLIATLVAELNFFFEPLKNVFTIDSMLPYHYVTFKITFLGILIISASIIIFLKKALIKNRNLIFFVVVYFLNMRMLWGVTGCSSRHLAYSSLLFCIVISFLIVYLYDFFMNMIKLGKFTKEIILVLIVTLFCVLNIVSIRLELFRGRLANTFWTYDYIRTAYTIKNDLMKINYKIQPDHLYIDNVPLMPYPFDPLNFSCDADPSEYYSMRFVLVQAFNDPSMLNVHINQISKKNKEEKIYRMDYEKVRDIYGTNIEPFFYLFNEALSQVNNNNYSEALRLFQKAARTRPFFINYILAKYDLEDSRWITNQMSLRPWINKIQTGGSASKRSSLKIKDDEYIFKIINMELDEYVKCLFFISYLEYRNGNIKESKYWFSRMGYIENNYNELLSKLTEAPDIKLNNQMLSFLKKYGNDFFYSTSDEGYARGFHKFIIRMLLNYDIL